MGVVNEVLCLVDVSKTYGKRPGIQGLDLTVLRGEIVGILGPNGSGKSTILHVATGLLPASSGTVRIAGVDVEDKRSRRHLGFAPDDLPMPEAMTGREYLAFHDRLRGIDTSDYARVLVDTWDLSGSMSTLVAHYSHGMKRKLQLVAATVHRPELLILDEPFRGLDPESVGLLKVLMRSLKKGQRGGILVATHDTRHAQALCDRVVIIDKARVVAEGSVYELQTEFECRSLREVFIRATGREEVYARRRTLLTDGDVVGADD